MTQLELNDELLIGRGTGRACYVHPDNPALCVKVAINERGIKESRRENFYLKRVVRHDQEDIYTHLARVHGFTATNLGVALVVERVCDEPSGRSSGVLRDALTEEAIVADRQGWDSAYTEFMEWTRRSIILFRDRSPNNICVKHLSDGSWRFVIIDGFAPKEVLLRWFPSRALAQRRNQQYARRADTDSLDALLRLCQKERQQVSELEP